MEKKCLIMLVFIICSCFPVFAIAEVIVLKSGKTVEGKIIEQTDKYVKIDFSGVPLTYFFEDIVSIDGKKPINISVTFDDPNMAVAFWEVAIKNEPNNYAAYNKLGLAYAELNKINEALNCFQRAIEINPNFGESYALLGATYISLKEIEKAILNLKKAIDLGYTDIGVYNRLGVCYYFIGDFSEAINYLDKYVNSNPQDIQMVSLLIDAYRKVGEFQKAKETYLKLKEIYQKQNNQGALEQIEAIINGSANVVVK